MTEAEERLLRIRRWANEHIRRNGTKPPTAREWRLRYILTSANILGPMLEEEAVELSKMLEIPKHLKIDPAYGQLDCDTLVALNHWNHAPCLRVLEVGANEEPIANILMDNGHEVIGVDLRDRTDLIPNYIHTKADLLEWSHSFPDGFFDAAVSTSAIEHFGLNCYGFGKVDPDHDKRTVDEIYRVLKPSGCFYITVPYGREFVQMPDWRVYCKRSLPERIIRKFAVDKKVFFKSGGCVCPDEGGIVAEADADRYHNPGQPHVTFFAVLRKQV